MTQPEGVICPTHQKKSRPRTSHSEELIMGDKDAPVRTRSSFKPSKKTLLGLISLIKPISIDEALLDNEWIMYMQEELDQFNKNDIWDLIHKPKGVYFIRTKLVFRNKHNEKGEVAKNKVRMVTHSYSQQEGIDYT